MDKTMGICPKCHGSTRNPYPVDLDPRRRYTTCTAGYDPNTDTLACDNCGGQTMNLKATGEVPLRQDGTPCLHEYVGHQAGNCYRVYQCKHCPSRYDIDSGD